jgi:hypothetical protein
MFLLRWVCLATLCLLWGCTVAPKHLYDGERRGTGEEVILSAEGIHSTVGFHPKIFISKIDGKSTRDVGATLVGQAFPYPHEVYLLPGRHDVQTIYVLGLSYATADLWFDSISGQKYTIRALSDGYKARIWIEDATGTPVGGIGNVPPP